MRDIATMLHFDHEGLEIAYVDEGEGEPILLIHGFGSNHQVNWVGTGWVDLLKRQGRRVIAFDNRGHGQSSKPHVPDAYHPARMAGDAAALLDHLRIGSAPVMGYSMGARIAAFMALDHPHRVDALILGGLGIHLVRGEGLPPTIAQAMEAPSLADVHDAMGRMFRAFADQTGSDRRALAACIRGSRVQLNPAEAARIVQPVLVAVGTRDPIAGSARDLADLLPNASVLDIPGRDHNPAVGDKVFKQGVLAFLAEEAV
ncbi:alpha/beta fold hydrolase [Labrys monachus]|uniref:Pimeloyl-ACP methyl ester carboxylesterase n=1 Tax=Labrys monachus TaxID=217067 RepID=A0ABU0FHG8_9HYPH|nr:alpha/beta hydrolase [Labrys monachus]MDQ0393931.1 pimeloyl-ACP methyl ester carboxylesterase [Labrys monachus]